MVRKTPRFGRLKSGDPDQKLPVLVEEVGTAPRRDHKRNGRKPSMLTILSGLMIVSAFGFGYGINSGSSESLAVTLPETNCNIKGNVSINTGKRIYHVPGQTDYDATRISPRYGERWFCSEEEAQRAGWRKARN
jgi:hypothetical protein